MWDAYESEKWTGVYPGFYGQNMHAIETDTPEETVAYMIQELNKDKARYGACALFPPHSSMDLAEAMQYYGVNETNYYNVLENA